MSVNKKSEVFEGLEPVNEAGIDDWKMQRIVDATAGYIIDLSGRWDISMDEIGSRPVEVKVVNDRGSVGEEGIELSDPDLYRTVMRNNYDDQRVMDRVDDQYPVQFHQIPEEVGQLMGDRADNNWEFSDNVESIARDELHGDLAKMEYFPWFVELEKDTWTRDLAILGAMNGEQEIEYLQRLQEQLSDTKEPGNPGEVSETLEKALDNAPTDELVEAYNTKYEERPQPFSRNVLSAYAPVESLDSSGREYEDFERPEGEMYQSFDGWIDEFVSIGADELREVRDHSLEYDSRADRAYLVAAEVAEGIDESTQLDPSEVITADEKTSRYIRKRLQEQDSRVRSQMGL